jgi:hypothetical protein
MWKIGPCGRCHQSSFFPNVNIQKVILCPNCGNRIALRNSVEIGYTLSRSVWHSMKEGLVPVVQTGRFLKYWSNYGFFYLPGVKYSKNGADGDIDFVACCDGHLIFAECKTLENTSSDATKTWNDIVGQFLTTAEVAIECKASLAVLAAQAKEFPAEVQQSIQDKINGRIPFLLLNHEDLEKGSRSMNRERNLPWLTLDELLQDRFPETPIQFAGGPRTIKTRWSTFSRESASESEHHEG